MKHMSEAIICIGVLTLITLCSGTPDVLDGITHSLMKDECKYEGK